MTTMDLSGVEQVVLDAAAMEVNEAEQRLSDASGRLEDARRRLTLSTGRFQGVMRAVLTLRAVNPDAVTAEWDQRTQHVQLKAVEQSDMGGDKR